MRAVAGIPNLDLSAAGAGLGLMLGLGLLLVWAGLPRFRRPGLEQRLYPYLRDAPRPSRLLAVPQLGGSGALAALLRPVVTDLARGIEKTLGGSASVRRRLLRAGKAADLDRFRAEQVQRPARRLAAAEIGPAGVVHSEHDVPLGLPHTRTSGAACEEVLLRPGLACSPS